MVVNLAVRPRPGIVVNDTQFSPWLYLVNNVQFDSVSESISWQFRLRWIVEPGNDLYVVYTQNWRNDMALDRFATQDRCGAAKFVYTFRY